jgi:hypothetical protein
LSYVDMNGGNSPREWAYPGDSGIQSGFKVARRFYMDKNTPMLPTLFNPKDGMASLWNEFSACSEVNLIAVFNIVNRTPAFNTYGSGCITLLSRSSLNQPINAHLLDTPPPVWKFFH